MLGLRPYAGVDFEPAGRVARWGGEDWSKPMPGQETMSTFVRFPENEEVLESLRAMEGHGRELEPLFRLVADRLAHKTYDRSAFVFILIELIYEFKGIYGGPLGELLSRSVLALTDDPELADSALEAYREIKETLEPGEPEPTEASEDDTQSSMPDEEGAESVIDEEFLEEAFPAPPPEPLVPDAPRAKSPEQEELMLALQEAQKKLADLGLSTRMAIDLTLSRPTRENVSHTLREIESLCSTLRGFEALLAESRELILEEFGVLEQD